MRDVVREFYTASKAFRKQAKIFSSSDVTGYTYASMFLDRIDEAEAIFEDEFNLTQDELDELKAEGLFVDYA